MKKRIVIILITALLLLCACQPTPETEFVVNKSDQQQMIEKAQEDAVYASPTAETVEAIDGPEKQGVDWAARLGAPEHYSTTLKSAGGHLTVEVDAKMSLPNVELPVARIEPYFFSDEDVLRFVHALLGEDLKCVDPSNENGKTKAMWEKEILQLKDDLDHWEEYGNLIWDSYDTKADFEKHLQEMMAKAATAPEIPEIVPFTLNWEYWNVWNKDGKQETTDCYASILVLNEDGTESNLTIDRSTEFGRCGLWYMREAGSDVHFPALGDYFPNELNITREEAQAAAEEMLREMGLDHLSCAFGKSIRCYRGDAYVNGAYYEPYWAFVFTREVNGAQQGYTMQTVVEPTDYTMSWTYEQCRVLVDEKGIAYMEYENPGALNEVKVPAATLMPFSKIQEIFEKMVLIVDNTADIYSRDEQYRITEVRLCLVSVPEQNGEGSLLVPCWDFLGEMRGGYPQAWRDLGMQMDETYCYLTINAVDGSIITRG